MRSRYKLIRREELGHILNAFCYFTNSSSRPGGGALNIDFTHRARSAKCRNSEQANIGLNKLLLLLSIEGKPYDFEFTRY